MKKTSRPIQFLRLSICFVLLLTLVPFEASAWGRKGHHVVARIAFNHLSAKSKAAITKLLQADQNDKEQCAQQSSLVDKFACISTWADAVRRDPGFTQTASNHFVNIPVFVPAAQRHYDANRDCASKDCIIAAIESNRAILADGSKPAAARVQALKFLVHFLGDLHQPLHNVMDKDLDAANPENQGRFQDKGDRGGNLKLVNWLGETSSLFGCWNLHAVWDDGLFDGIKENDTALAQSLDAKLTTSQIAKLSKGDVVAWSEEGLKLAISKVYKLPKRNPNDKACEVRKPDSQFRECRSQDCQDSEIHYRYTLDTKYRDKNVPVVKSQLSSGGIRLAHFLNTIFDAMP
ncbi:MAG: hypothetical protein JST84_25885 [Acidobacteria bacterium]|nr:hypothetical protein [Acidobacteriota bacterium]